MAASKAQPKIRKVNLSPEEEQARQVLNVTMRLFGLTDANVGEPIEHKYQWVQQRRRGETRIRMGDMVQLAKALDVPESLFGMDPLDAGAWLLANRREQVIAASRCTERWEAAA